MAIRAIARRLRIVKGTRALAGNSAGLPVVVLIEAANPAVMVDRHIQVDFVAGGTKFRRLQAHKGLEERAAVRLGIQAHDKVVQGPRSEEHTSELQSLTNLV